MVYISGRKVNFYNFFIYLFCIPLIAMVFFFRGDWFGIDLSLTIFIPLLSFLLLFILLFRDFVISNKIFLPPINMILLIFFFIMNPLIGILLFQQSTNINISFFFELMLNISLYYIFYQLIAQNYLKVRYLFILLVIFSTYISSKAFIEVYKLDSLRRFNQLETGVNLLGHSLSIATIIIFYWILNNKNTRLHLLLLFSLFIVNFTSVLLTGSRSSLLILLIGFVLIGFNYIKRINFINILLSIITIVIIMVVFYLIAKNPSFQGLVSRWDIQGVIYSSRIDIWLKSLDYMTVQNLLVGDPSLYNLYNFNNIHPHNIFLSLLLYTGIIPTIIFMLVIIVWVYKINKLVNKSNLTKSLYIAILIAPLLYASLSGELTRIMTIFVIGGIIEGIIYKENKNHCLKVD